MTIRHAPRWAIMLLAYAGFASAYGQGAPEPVVPGQIIVRLDAQCDIETFVAQCLANHAVLGLDLAVVSAIDSESTYLLA